MAALERFDIEPAMTEPFQWRGFRDPRGRRRRWEQDGYLGSWHVHGHRRVELARHTPPAGSLDVGILLVPEHRGRGVGTEAQRLLADYLFSTTAANRLEATTEVDNVAEQRALEKAGFTKEGLLRGCGFVRGEWRDGYVYGRLRSD